MKIKEQTRKLAAGCSKHCFKVVDGTDEVSSKHCFEVVDRTDEVSNHIYGKATLTWFEEIFEEYKSLHNKTHITKVLMNNLIICAFLFYSTWVVWLAKAIMACFNSSPLRVRNSSIFWSIASRGMTLTLPTKILSITWLSTSSVDTKSSS